MLVRSDAPGDNPAQYNENENIIAQFQWKYDRNQAKIN